MEYSDTSILSRTRKLSFIHLLLCGFFYDSLVEIAYSHILLRALSLGMYWEEKNSFFNERSELPNPPWWRRRQMRSGDVQQIPGGLGYCSLLWLHDILTRGLARELQQVEKKEKNLKYPRMHIWQNSKGCGLSGMRVLSFFQPFPNAGFKHISVFQKRI